MRPRTMAQIEPKQSPELTILARRRIASVSAKTRRFFAIKPVRASRDWEGSVRGFNPKPRNARKR
jgi:hypothetical protein